MDTYSDPYTILRIARTATADEVKQAYFALVRQHPPERDPETFKRIRAAYERLRSPDKRAETDMLLLQPWPAPRRTRRSGRLELSVHREDIIAAARAMSDLERSDFREDFREVKL